MDSRVVLVGLVGLLASLGPACSSPPASEKEPPAAPTQMTVTPVASSTSSAAPAASGPPATSAATPEGKGQSMTLRPIETGPFTRGPAVTPAADLVRWLDAQSADAAKPRLVRLPVSLTKGSLRGAHVGTGPGALEIDVVDYKLGVGLADHARKCQAEPTCLFWLEGFWQGKKDGRFVFDVAKVHAHVPAAQAAAASYAEVEAR